MRRTLAALTVLAALTPITLTTASTAAVTLPRPDGNVEMQGTSNGGTALAIKAGNAPAGATTLAIKFRNEQDGKLYSMPDCPKSVATSATGCVIDLKPGFPNRAFRVYWKGPNSATSPSWTFYAGDLSTMKSGSDTMLEGTKEMVWVSGTAQSAARIYKATEGVLKAQASGCLKDAGVSAGLAAMKKAAGSAMKSANPYVAGAGMVGHAIAKQDSKTFDNRCKGIALAVGDFAAAIKNAQATGKPSRVYLTSIYGKWNNLPDTCVIYTSSGGAGGDSSGGSHIVTRPQTAGGPTQTQCLHFWDAVVG